MSRAAYFERRLLSHDLEINEATFVSMHLALMSGKTMFDMLQFILSIMIQYSF